MADTDFRALVESKTTDLEGLLSGSGLTVERFKATVFQLWDQDYELRKCSPNSILAGVMAVADVGLTFTKTLGHAYLVPFKQTAVPIIGARGLSHLALKSGAALDIRTGIRREGEVFRYRPLHPTEPIVHEPLASYDEEGNYAGDAPASTANVVGYYAVAFLPGGLVRAEYMDIGSVAKHRDKYSRAAKDGPWVTAFDEMAKKTLVRKLCKYMRLSSQLEKAVHISDSVDATLDPSEPAPDDPPRPVVVVPDVDGQDGKRVDVTAGSERVSAPKGDSPLPVGAASRSGGADDPKLDENEQDLIIKRYRQPHIPGEEWGEVVYTFAQQNCPDAHGIEDLPSSLLPAYLKHVEQFAERRASQ